MPAPSPISNHQLGVDRPLLVQYWDWISHFVTGDMGMSYHLPRSRSPRSWARRWPIRPSSRLVAFVLVVPLGILGGVLAALHVGRPLDRIISIVGLSATVAAGVRLRASC